MYALKVAGFSLELLGHPVIAHLERLRSICDHCGYFCSLVIWGWICLMLSVIMAKSSAYAVVVYVALDVLKWYPMSSFSSHLKRGSRKMINRYGLSVSPWIVPRLMLIGGVA